MVNLKNEIINHRSLGQGYIIEQTDKYVKVKFSNDEKQFLYPEAFEKFLICSDARLHKEVLVELIEKKQNEAERKSKKQKEWENIAKTHQKTEKRMPNAKRNYPKANIAFKCNFCDGGKSENGIGYKRACSDEVINYNIEIAQHNWCCSAECPCGQYYDGIIDRATLDSYAEKGGFVCYESQMLRKWTAYAGYALTKENHQKPLTLRKVQINSLAILTTRIPTEPEKDRFVFGVFLVDEAYEGDNRDEGYVTTTSKYKLNLSIEEARHILFWKYYSNSNAPEKIAWGQGLHRYLDDTQAACILRDIVTVKKNTADEKLAKELFEYFCKINELNSDILPKQEGALQR